jgi:mannose-6-phosphate isomerase
MPSDTSETRPWGSFEVLSDSAADHKVKCIIVLPGKRLSLQLHHKRSEHWFVVKGKGVVTVGEDLIDVLEGTALDIPVETKHRIENTGDVDLIFVEIQTGDYFGEDDIERFEDDYGRE